MEKPKVHICGRLVFIKQYHKYNAQCLISVQQSATIFSSAQLSLAHDFRIVVPQLSGFRLSGKFCWTESSRYSRTPCTIPSIWYTSNRLENNYVYSPILQSQTQQFVIFEEIPWISSQIKFPGKFYDECFPCSS